MCWDTIFNGIGAISTLGAAIAAGVAAYKLHMQTKEVSDTQTKLSIENINIMLFERRYKIFESFSKLYELRNFIDTASSNIKFPDGMALTGREMLNMLVFDHICDEERKKLKEEIGLLSEKLKTTDNKKYEKTQREIALKNQEILFNEIKVAKLVTNEIEMSRYCFPSHISDLMCKYTDLMLNLSLRIGTIEEKPEEVIAELKKVIEKIEEENILTQVERFLDISFEANNKIKS